MGKKDFRFGISSSLKGVDVNDLLVENAASSFFMEVAEDMAELNLQQKDIVLVDRSLLPRKTDIVVVSDQTEAALRLQRWKDVDRQTQSTLWGVVVHVIRRLRK